jgi:DNA-binding CsgD family transcriptional regulator
MSSTAAPLTQKQLQSWLDHPIVKRAARKIGWTPYSADVDILDLFEQVNRETDALEGVGFTCKSLTEAAGLLPVPDYAETQTEAVQGFLAGQKVRKHQAKIRAWYVQTHPDMSAEAIAKELGVSKETVNIYRRQLGMTGVGARTAAGRREQILAYLIANPAAKLQEVADVFEVSIATISKIRTANGISVGHHERSKATRAFVEANLEMSTNEMARTLGVHHTTITKIKKALRDG